MKKIGLLALCLTLLLGCTSKKTVPVVGFLDAFEDNTIAQAKNGFMDALKANGFSEEQKTVEIIYRNAQGDIPKLTLSMQYLIAQKVDLIASNPSLSTITAVQSTKEIPIFMMVSPLPALMKVVDAAGKAPANLYGVAESLDYLDSSLSLIPKLMPQDNLPIKVGILYNQAEPQSVEALQHLQLLTKKYPITLVVQSVSSSADVQLVTQALLAQHIDVFFANPDNVVFSAFEAILAACNAAKVPVFTSEAGLVQRGAAVAYGADMYQWGYQAGMQAAQYLQHKNTDKLTWQLVEKRQYVYNKAAIENFHISIPSYFIPIK